jgi:DnaJ like chaperone protein
MTENQLAVILFGVPAGYWIVSKCFERSRDPVKAKRPLGQPEREEKRPRPEQPAPKETWSEVLGISSSAGIDEIRHAYRRMITQYHPDKVASLGLELRELAELKSKQITMAYREAMRMRGIGNT